MPSLDRIKVGLIRKNELAEADRILRVAFGTFLGLPNPAEFMGDRDQLKIPDLRAGFHAAVFSAGAAVKSNVHLN